MATIPVFLPGEFHGQRSLVGYSPWGCKELDMTEQLTWREPKAQALSQASGSAVLYQGVLGPPHERRLCPTQAALVQSGTCTVSSVVRAWPGVNECVCVCVYTCGISRPSNAQKVLLKVRPVRSEGLAHPLRPWHQDSAFPPRSVDRPLSQAEQGGAARVVGRGVG